MRTKQPTTTASAPETRKNDPNLNWAMYNPDKANPRTIPAEKPTALQQAKCDHAIGIRNIVAQRDEARAHADKLAEALRECQTQFGSLGYSQPTKHATKRFLAINEIARAALAAYEESR
jgi:hypothetical protein